MYVNMHQDLHTHEFASLFCKLVLAKTLLLLSGVVWFWTSQVLSYEGSNGQNDHTMCSVAGSGVMAYNNRH